jgi:glucose/arabinose dehydrogenase
MYTSILYLFAFIFMGCNDTSPINSLDEGNTAISSYAFSENNDELILPEGFRAVVVHEGVGRARHMVARGNGDVYIKLSRPQNGHGMVALRDTDGDGVADETAYFGPDEGGTGIDIYNDFLYFSSDVAVYRLPLGEGLVPEGEPERIAYGFRAERQHAAKTFTFDQQGHLYVNVGAPANACQEEMRTPGSPGMDPCPILEHFGGVWRFDANAKDQHQDEAYHYATGLRHCVAIDWDAESNHLYTVMHGRDQLDQLFPEHFNAQQNAELPGEEFQRLTDQSDHGWPYSYYDWQKGKRMQAPEYGGNGEQEAGGDFNAPLYSFPGHWAPNDLLFYKGDQFPASYKNGAFVAFHGSWNRAPMPQRGYNVAFVPFEEGEVSGAHSDFADNFARKAEIASPNDAEFRPMGLAEAEDGSLYICDSKKGRVWRIVYTGN